MDAEVGSVRARLSPFFLVQEPLHYCTVIHFACRFHGLGAGVRAAVSRLPDFVLCALCSYNCQKANQTTLGPAPGQLLRCGTSHRFVCAAQRGLYRLVGTTPERSRTAPLVCSALSQGGRVRARIQELLKALVLGRVLVPTL